MSIYIIVLIILVLFFIFESREMEKISQGALTQLVAKGPQDSYLTVGTEKYWHPYFYPWWWFRWPSYSYIGNVKPYNYYNPFITY
jgi:hypothetical protein